MKIKVNNTTKISKFAFLLILIIQVCCLFYFNFTSSEDFLDFDSSLALRHAVEMLRNHTIFLPDFNHTSSLEIDCASFFAAPIFLLTGNISLAYGISHAVLILLTIYIANETLKLWNVDTDVRCITLSIILTPYSVGQLEYINMLFISAGQYIFRILTLFFIFYFLEVDIKTTSKKKLAALLVIFAVILTITAISCGIYALIVIAPFCLAHFIDWINQQKIKISDFKTIFLAASSLIAVICALIHNRNIENVNNRGQVLCTYDDFSSNFLGCFTGLFTFLGAIPRYKNISVFSLFGIATITKMIFVIAAICMVIWGIKKCRLSKSKPLNYGFWCILCHLFILIVTSSHYSVHIFENRYHIIWIEAFFLIFGLCLNFFKHNEKNLYLKNFIFIAIFLSISIINYDGFTNIRNYTKINSDSISGQIITIANEQDINTVLIYGVKNGGTVSHIIRAKDPDINGFNIEDDFKSADTLDFYKNAVTAEKLGKTNLLFTKKDKFKELPESIRSKYVYQGEINEISYYRTDDNPCGF